jgi:hypothetical protein
VTGVLPEEFERRSRETRDAISLVIGRWDRPSPFRSWAEAERTLAEAYETRAQFWNDVIEYAIDHSDFPSGLLFDALLDARQGCEQEARHARREARQYAQRDQERAVASYGDNIAATVAAESPAVAA